MIMAIQFSRFWAMPSADTFDCEPIKGFVQKYLMKSKVSVDPFSRNKRWATYTNDLNPNTAAESHTTAVEFLESIKTKGVVTDLIIFDPPYSPRQVKEVYESIGKKFEIEDQWNTGRWTRERELIAALCPKGIVLSFGWNTQGVGKKNGFDPIEILMVCHGGAHNDTICMAERRMDKHPDLFSHSPANQTVNKVTKTE